MIDALSVISAQPIQCLTLEPEGGPVVPRLCAHFLIEGNCQVVPIEDRPFQPSASPLTRDASDLSEQGFSEAISPRRRPHENVLQKDSAAAKPSRKIVKEERETRGVAIEIRDEHFGRRRLAEQLFRQSFNRRYSGLRGPF